VLSNAHDVVLFEAPPSSASLFVVPQLPRLECVSVQGEDVQPVIRAIVDATKSKLRFRLLAKETSEPDLSQNPTALLVLVGYLSSAARRSQLLAFAMQAPVMVLDDVEALAWSSSQLAVNIVGQAGSMAVFLVDERMRLLKRAPSGLDMPEKVFRYATTEVVPLAHLVTGDGTLPVDMSRPGWGSRLEARLSVQSGPRVTSQAAIATALTMGKLKTLPRTGWALRGIAPCESVADHSHRVSALALLLAGTGVDVVRACAMGLVHDLAEAVVGDIAPSQGVDEERKRMLEREAMDGILEDLGDNEVRARAVDGERG